MANSLNKALNLPASLLKYIKEARAELKQVTWPTREVTINYSLAVIVASLIVGAVTGGFDYLLSILLERTLF